ncbi:MAG: PKD domain-containing protein, partial [Thermoplasmata archaeon]
IGRNYAKGWINIDVFWKDLDNSTAWESEGDGTIASGLTVRAERFDQDDDGLEDDVLISVENQLGLPVRNADITINRTDYGSTDLSGELTALNLKRGFWIVNASKLNLFGSTTFFSEGQGPGTATDEYFFDIEWEVVDRDKDDRKNDLKLRFDVDVEPAIKSDVVVWTNMSHLGNGTHAYNVSTSFSVEGTKTDWHTSFIKNVTYGMYFVNFTLLDKHNNTEDLEVRLVRLVRPSNHVNIETGVFYEEDDNAMDDALFRAVRVDEAEANITIKLFNDTDVQVRSGKTNENGRRWFRDLRDGVFNWTATDEDGRLVEKGRIVIGARVQVDTDLIDMDFDGFFDDFVVDAYNNVGRGVATVTVTVWAPNGTEIATNITLRGTTTAMNLTKGTYEFNATYLGEELVNGTFYSYGNVDEPFKVVVRPEARDIDGDGRYDDVNVTVVDTDDSPLEFANIYVDGVYKTRTDLNGSAQVKDLGWGIHVIEARYSGEVAKARFFSEGPLSKAKWTMLVMKDDESYLDDLETVGSTNDTVLLYYAESTNARPKQARLWIVMDGESQDIDVTRLGTKFKAGESYDIEDEGVIEALLTLFYGSFASTRSALFFFGTQTDADDPFAFEGRLDTKMSAMGEKANVLAYPRKTRWADYLYEMRNVSYYAVGSFHNSYLPIVAMAQEITSDTTTTGKELGELAIDKVKNDGKEDAFLADMARMGAFATALDAMSTDLIASYPDEGWTVQDARNVTSYPYGDGPEDMAVYIGDVGDELEDTLTTASSKAKATALKDAVSAFVVKTASTTAGPALLFPNSTAIWDDSTIQLLINSSALAADTDWDEFLEAFWTFRGYGINVNATAFDKEGSGRDNDVRVHINDTYGRDIQGARVHIDLIFKGTTDVDGMLESYNYTRGVHVVNVTWGDYTAEDTFTSEGTLVPNVAPSVTITDPEEAEEINSTYSVRGTASDSDGSVVRVDVRFNGGSWETALGRTTWRYDWDTTQVADGDWLIEARAFDGDLWSPIDKVNVTVLNPVVYADILLVDDDGGQAYEVWYTQALTANGETFDTISVDRNEDGPDADRLKEAKVVIWLTGEEDEGTLTAADVNALTEFLDSGGSLFLTGQDIGRDLTSEGTVTSAFMRDYLRADFVSDNANIYDLIAVPNEDISEGINISIEGGTGAPNQNYPSEIQPRAGAAVVYFYNATAEAAVKFGSSTFRTVYFAFGFEGIAVRADRNRIMDNVLEWLLSNATTGDNQLPVPNAGNDVVTMVGEVTILRGTATDPDGLVTLYEWDVDGDGTYDWWNETTGVAQWTYDTAGNYTAKLRVTDNFGDFATATVAVEVQPKPPNMLPVADAGEDVTVEQGDPVEFVMAGYDPDGVVVLYEWDYDGDGTYDEVSPTSVTTHHIYIDPGTYVATLRVTDDVGAIDTDDRTITVTLKVQNQPPTADAGPDLTVEVGDPVTLVGTGTDPDGWIATFKWDFDGDNEYDWTSTSTGTVEHTYSEEGVYVARFLVIDNNNTAATDTAVINVTPVHVNLKPTADAGPEEVQQAVQDVEMEFSGTGEDPDGFIVLYEWDFEGDGVWDWNDTQERVARHAYTETGLFIARFRVTDNDGATAQDVLRVQVSSSTTSNEPPTAEAGGPYDGVAGEPVTLSGSGSDTDGTVVSYEWDFEGDGTIDHFSPASGTTTKVYQSSGFFNAVIYVTDDDGAVATDSAVVRIERANAAPSVMVSDPVPGTVISGYYVVRGTSSDDMGVSIVEIKVDDGPWREAAGTLVWSYDIDTSSLVPGTHILRVRATDGNGEFSQVAEVQFTVGESDEPEEEPESFLGMFVWWVWLLLFVIPVAVVIIVVIRFKYR